MDMLIQNMNKKRKQEKVCTQREDNPQEAFRFAVAYEEGMCQHKHSKEE